MCPITNAIMVDPVQASDGYTYERSAIETWLQQQQRQGLPATSPMTRAPMASSELVPNRAIRDAIERYRAQGVRMEPVAGEQPPSNPAPQVSLEVVADVETGTVLVEIVPTTVAARTPVDICAVVDVSGSMGVNAKMKDAQGQEVQDGLEVLDIVKHALKTIAQSLGRLDRFSLVAYSSTARVVFELREMDEEGKAAAMAGIVSLNADGQTNIWDGLHTGLEVLRKGGGAASTGRVSSCLLLTDGQPNVVPPSGHVPMLRRYIDKNSLPATIHTFGFGYNLDSVLLHELASEVGGLYSFIPDASLVGTVFISTLANLFTTFSTCSVLSIELGEGVVLADDQPCNLVGWRSTPTSWGIEVSMGALQYEQSKSLVLKATIPPTAADDWLKVTLKYADGTSLEHHPLSATISCAPPDRALRSPKAKVAALRLRAAGCILRGLKLGAQGAAEGQLLLAQTELAECVAELGAADRDVRASCAGLIEDLSGQVTEAFSRHDWFTKWGRHYLPSLAGAHLFQICNNFKDPGVQSYGGRLFRSFRDDLEDVFCKLPPPKATARRPSVSSAAPGGPGAASRAAAPPIDMSMYNNRSNPCFAGRCLVKMADGRSKRVDAIRKGDLVASGCDPGSTGAPATVRCVVRTDTRGELTAFVRLGELLVTPWHPIRLPGGRWEFPWRAPGATTFEEECDGIYNFVLDAEHAMVIEGVACITLAHGVKDDEVAAHPYFGTSRVTEDLRGMVGWAEGVVRLQSGCAQRNADGLISRLVQAPSQVGTCSAPAIGSVSATVVPAIMCGAV